MYRLRKGRKKHKNNNVSFFNMVCEPNIPEFYTSLFINNKSKNSLGYGALNASRLIKFLNFLLDQNIYYWNATDQHVKAFFLLLINFDTKTDEIVSTPSVQYSTLQGYKNTIVSFYKFLWQFTDHSVLQIKRWEDGNLHDYDVALTLRWDNAERVSNATINLFVSKYKVSSKEYIMEYTEEEISAICSCFNNYRNKAIFLITLHGMRIDEVLSIKLKDYSPISNTVKPSRSKGTGRGRKRTVVLDDLTVQFIENYILHERNEAEIKSKMHSTYLFVNTRKVDEIIELTPYSYNSYRGSFMRSAKKAGLHNVRTHSGRSHRASELLKIMIDGKINLTDEIIRHIMGWKSPESIKPYVEHANQDIAIKFAKQHGEDMKKRLNEMKEELFKSRKND